jgi:hypothetical protein
VRVRIADLDEPRRREINEYVPWRLVTPRGRESCRWQCTDGRWVALTLGHDDEIGIVIVSCSDGQRELIDSYEAALTLARRWRT